MKMLVSHLTRMQRGSICVAGLDVETGHHVRPVLPLGVLSSRMTAPRGGPFDMATVVDLGLTRPVPIPPEIEDVEFTQWHARAERLVEPGLFWDAMRHVSRSSLWDVFGSGLRTIGRAGARRAVTDLDAGRASLGVLRPDGQPELYLSTKPDGREVVRMRMSDGVVSLDLSVTDLRLYTDDGSRADLDKVRDVADRLAWGVPCLLGVGLTRPFAARDGEPPLHWLQVNNLHLEDDPTWRLPHPGPPHHGREALLVGAGMSSALPDDELPF